MKKIASIDWQKTVANVLKKYPTPFTAPNYPEKKTRLREPVDKRPFNLFYRQNWTPLFFFFCFHVQPVNCDGFGCGVNSDFWDCTLVFLGKYNIKSLSANQFGSICDHCSLFPTISSLSLHVDHVGIVILIPTARRWQILRVPSFSRPPGPG